MNSIYKTVWSKSAQTMVVASELAKSSGKSSNKVSGQIINPKFLLSSLTVTLLSSISVSTLAAEGIIQGNNNYVTDKDKNSVAIGLRAKIGGVTSIAIGADAEADINKDTKNYPEDGDLLNGYEMWEGIAYKVPATAIGSGSKAFGRNAISIGTNAEVNSNRSIAIGAGSKSHGERSVSLGWTAKTAATADNSVSIGRGTIAEGSKAISIGHKSEAKKNHSIAVGEHSVVNAEAGISIGEESVVEAKAANAVILGNNNVAKSNSNVVIGDQSEGDGQYSIVIGTDSKIEALNTTDKQQGLTASARPQYDNAIVIGHESRSTNQNTVTLGHRATTYGEKSVAISEGAQARANRSIALGNEAIADQESAMAFGDRSKALGQNSVSFGSGSISRGNQALAFGSSSMANGQDSLALGAGAKVGVTEATKWNYPDKYRNKDKIVNKGLALGAGANVTKNNSVALGAGSVASTDAVTVPNATLNNLTYGDFAGQAKAASGIVSVGSAGNERQITNVASGRITADSTDAINGSQLHATNTILGNVAKTLKDNLGGNAAVSPKGDITFTDIGGTGKGNIHDAIKASKETVVAGNGIKVDEGKNDSGSSKYTVSLSDDILNKLKNPNTPPSVDTTSVEEVTAKTGSSVTVTAAKDKADGTGKTFEVALTKTAEDAIADVQNKANKNLDNIDDDGKNVIKGLVEAEGTAPINVETTAGTNGAKKFVVSLNDKGVDESKLSDPVVEKLNKVETVVAKDSNITVADTKLNGTKGKEFELSLNKDLNLSTANDGSIDGLADNITAPTDPKTATAPAGSHKAATVNDVLNAGWNLKENTDAKDFVKAFDTVAFVNGEGTTAKVTNTDGTTSEVTFNVNVDGTSIKVNDQGKLEAVAKPQETTTLTPTTDGTVTEPADGDKTKLVNAGDIAKAINGAGFKVKTTNGDGSKDQLVKMGETVELDEGKNIDVVQADNKFTIKTKDDLTGLNSVVLGDDTTDPNTVALTKEGIKAGNKKITNVAKGDISDDSKDAINGSQLKDLADKLGIEPETEPAKAGTFKAPTLTKLTNVDGTEPAAAPTNVVNAVNGLADKVNEGLTFGGNQGTAKQQLGSKLDVKGDVKDATATYVSSNITTEYTNTNGNGVIQISMKEKPKFKGVEIKEDDTKPTTSITPNGVTITPVAGTNKAPVTLTDNGLDNGGNKVTNVADGDVSATSKDAVNGSQLDKVAKASKEDVKSDDKSVTVVKTEAADGSNIFDLAVKVDDKTLEFVPVDANTPDGAKKLALKTTALTPANTGSITSPQGDEAKKLVNAGDITKAINGAFHQVTNSNTDTLATDEVKTAKIKAGSTLTFEAGKNLVSKMTEDGQLTVSTKNDVKFDSAQVGKVKINEDGNNQIGGLAKGTADDDAVNFAQLKDLIAKGNIVNKVAADNNATFTYVGTVEGKEVQLVRDVKEVNGKVVPFYSYVKDGKKVVLDKAPDDVHISTIDPITGIPAVPTQVANVKSTLPGSFDQTIPTDKVEEMKKGQTLLPNSLTDDQKHNAATISDVLSAGWNLADKAGYVDFVKPYETVKFLDGEGTTVEVKTEDHLTSTIKYSVAVDNKTTELTGEKADGTKVVKAKDGKWYTVGTDGQPTTTVVPATDVAKTIVSAKIVDTPFEYADKDGNPIVKNGDKFFKDGAEVPADKVVVKAKGTKPQSITNVASALGLNDAKYDDATNGSTNATVVPAQTAVKNLLKEADDKNLNKATSARDLQAVSRAGLDFAGDNSAEKTVHKNLGEKLEIVGGAAKAKLSDNNIGVNANEAGKLEVKLAKDVKGLDSVVLGDDANSPDTIALTKAGIKAGNKKITGVAKGTEDTDAVNKKQLDDEIKLSKEEVTAGNGIKVTKTEATADKAASFKVAVKTDGKTITTDKDGNITANTTALTPAATGAITEPQGDEAKKLVNAGDISKAINGAFHKVTNTNTDETVTAGKGTSNIKAGDTLTVETGKNLVSSLDDQGNLKISTQKEVEFDKVTVGGVEIDKTTGINAGDKKITGVKAGENDTDAVNVAQLNAVKTQVTSGNGVSVTSKPIAGGNGTSFEVAVKTDGKTITTDKDGNITANTTALTPVKTGDKAGSVTKPTGDEAKKLVNAGDIADAINNSGFTITAAGNLDGTATNEIVNPGDKVELVAGDNMTIKQEGGKFTLSAVLPDVVESPFGYVDEAGNEVLKKGDKFVKEDGVVLTPEEADKVVVKAKGKKPQQVTNIKSTLVGSKDNPLADKDAGEKSRTGDVKDDQLNNAATVSDVLSAGWNLKGNGSDVDFVKAYDTVDFVNGTGTTVTVETKDNAVSTVKVDVAVDDATITTEEYGQPDKNGKKATRIKANTTALTPTAEGKIADLADADAKKLVNAGDIKTAINSVYHTVKNTNTGGKVTANAGSTKVGAGSTLTIDAGNNLISAMNDGVLTIGTKDSVAFDDVKVGDVVINKDSGINAGNKQITGVASALALGNAKYDDATDGANGATVKPAQTAVKNLLKEADDKNLNKATSARDLQAVSRAGVDFAGDNSAEKTVHKNLGEKLEIVGGADKAKLSDNNIGVNAKAGKLEVKLAKDVKGLDSIVLGSQAGDNVVSLNANTGINAGNKQIKGVKAGVADTDAVNVGQLKASNANIAKQLGDLDKNMRAGVAGAFAAANLGQPHDPGASTVGIAVGTYRGESALSLGLSTISDNGKWILKGSISHDTSNYTGAGASINYQW
ncbi:Haemagglutinin [Phocoenobacter uteri]|uniref:Haemagglutinin n=1 Tax=Phocoenobacter uteri TaxID=146806 RepID=A0A379CBP3_9PAST|nr:YadA-like family protein [Phocoenobacter uteri]MDG6881518.1 hypothetical protein [Phocoenobacter uteri]SUB59548.1 Haemagglutinin [Phocoenobacter uteri]